MSLLPSEIALELVPNSYDFLQDQAEFAIANSQNIRSINIPEMMSKPIKGHDAARFYLQKGIDAIPHFRTRERTLGEFEILIAELEPLGLRKVLLITGDPPKDNPSEVAALTPVQAIPHLKKVFPQIQFYVGVDPYRQSFRDEIDYCQRKQDAGADGFFSQPFFSTHLLSLWLEQLRDTEFWMGLSPVTTDSFRGYWERMNRVVFPPSFDISLADNCTQERKLLELVAQAQQKAYLMPITVSVQEYLPVLFAK